MILGGDKYKNIALHLARVCLQKASHGKRRVTLLGLVSYRAMSPHLIFVTFCVIFCVAVTKISVNVT